jgi:cytosine/adenosine deaminase-related metal-dependent hydrolase
MTTLYCAGWVLPISSSPIAKGAIAVEGQRIVAVGERITLAQQFPNATVRDCGDSAIIPGLINVHSHLELTAMRGFLEGVEHNFFAWLQKLTIARLQRMTADDLYVSSSWGASEAARAGVTCVADASSSAGESMRAIRDTGLRGVVFQESFGPDPRLANENFEKLKTAVSRLREQETALVRCGVSPHAPYSVCAPQLEMISRFAIDEGLPMMMHAAETEMEISLIRDGRGPFANGLRERGIEWQAPGVSPIQYLNDHGVLQTRPLLAHCIHVDRADIEKLHQTGSKVAHCPKSNAKLGHGIAPLRKLLDQGVEVGLGSDSVASNNTCDLFEEARVALLLARAEIPANCLSRLITANEVLQTATLGGARALGFEGQVGELRAGLQADFAVVSLDGAHQVPSYDPATTLIFSSSASDVSLTVVAGKEIYCDGELTTIDDQRLRARMSEIAGKLRT